MRKVLVLLLLLLVVFAIACRNRLYVRDPLGKLSRGGVREEGAQVYINFPNDVLVENDNPPRYVEVIQHGQHAGVPQQITCLHWAVCLLNADSATLQPGSRIAVEVMNGRVVQFRDAKGEADISLR